MRWYREAATRVFFLHDISKTILPKMQLNITLQTVKKNVMELTCARPFDSE